MCQDINHIKRIINQSAPAPLVIDLQNNSGGSENTPWIAALTLNGFFDNQVKYRNIGYLQQSDIRENAFYYSQRAENWYRNLDHEALATEAFLPVRTDFCRGSEICEVKKIYSAKYPIQYTDVKLVINSRCVSSCDDFIWRMRQYTGAETFGQLPATDGAYARLNGYLFVSDKNQVVNVILGEDMEPPKIKGQLWLRYRVPISKTVDQAGNNLEGEPSVLDYPLPVTMDNFHRLAEDNLQRAMFYAQ